MVTTEIIATVRAVIPPQERGIPPKKVHMSFKRKRGDPVLYGEFVRDLFEEKMKMFMCQESD